MRLRELDEAHDYVSVKDELNPVIWENGHLKIDVREKLIKIARAFEEFVGIDLEVEDYTLTGSNANFTWTEYSDLDLHLIVPGTPSDEQRELFMAKKSLWSEQHNITIKRLPVECYVQGSDEEHHSTGVYSITKNAWLIKPQKVKPDVDDAAVEAKKDAVLHQVEQALLSNDLAKLQKVKERITTMRRAGLALSGEWSVENLVFKILRNLGLIDELTDKIRELEDQELSLEQQTNVLD